MTLIRKAAVLGAGAMGSGIAAHLANAGIPTLLLDIVPGELAPDEAKKGLKLSDPQVRNRFALKGIEGAKKGGFGHPDRAKLVTPGNFEDDLAKLADVDWVVEAVVERLEIKTSLFARAAVHLKPGALLTSNTSGLSINAMADALPGALRPRFFGTHFFNPPRYMYLLELIPARGTDPDVLAGFREFAEVRLGKGIVVGKDTPNFVANRIGMYANTYPIHVMEKHGFGVEEVDAATGKVLGRAGLACFGTHDLAGIDTFPHVLRTQVEGAPDDECRDQLALPEWIKGMIERGYYGRKSGAGFYKDKGTLAIDPATLEYHPKRKVEYESLAVASKIGNPGARIAAVVYADDAAGRFAWDVTASTLLYAANRVPEIEDELPAIDRAMRWGYAWELGPFEIWDALGVKRSLERMEAEGRKIPGWLKGLAESATQSFYVEDGAGRKVWDVAHGRHVPLSSDPKVIVLADLKKAGKKLAGNESATLVDLGDRVACVEFHAKMNLVDEASLAMLEEAVANAGTSYDALVVGNQGALFSAGADLRAMSGRALRGDWEAIDSTLRTAQRVMMAMKYAPIPIVAAPFGKVLGGGLEVCLHCHRIQASHETSLGLVEGAAGVVPGAGGAKELALRAAAAGALSRDPFQALLKAFQVLLYARVSGSAWDAFDLGYMQSGDGVTMNREHLLHEAKNAALGMLTSGWQPLRPATIKVMGVDGLANLRAVLYDMRQGGFLSEHDVLIGDKMAQILSGGEVDHDSVVDENHLLALERKVFVELCHETKTTDRMQHILTTGKPLKN